MAVQKVRAKTEYQILIIQQKQHPLCVLFTVEYEDDKEFCYLQYIYKTYRRYQINGTTCFKEKWKGNGNSIG